MLLSWNDLVSELNITAPSDGTTSLAVMLPQKAEKWGLPLECSGVRSFVNFVTILGLVYFARFFALHLDRVSQWVLKKWLLMRAFQIAEIFLVSRVAAGGLSDSIKSFSLLWASAGPLFPIHSTEVSQACFVCTENHARLWRCQSEWHIS